MAKEGKAAENLQPSPKLSRWLLRLPLFRCEFSNRLADSVLYRWGLGELIPAERGQTSGSIPSHPPTSKNGSSDAVGEGLCAGSQPQTYEETIYLAKEAWAA